MSHLTSPTPRTRNLLAALMGGAAFWWFLLGDLPLWFYWFPRVPDLDDFTLYFAAARLGLEHGWSHIYDYQLQATEFARLHSAAQSFDWRSFYITPPPMAWLVAPLTVLPHPVAFYVWAGLLLAAYLWVGVAALSGALVSRLAVVLLGLTTFPVLSSLRFGNAAMLVTLAVVGSWLCLRQERRYWAGVLLTMLFLKPQTAYLVPVAIALCGEWKPVAVTALGISVLTLASIASLGPAGLTQWRELSGQEPAHLQNQVWTAAVLVGPGTQALVLEGLVAALVVLVALLSRGRSLELAIAAGLAGSLLAAPYHNAADGMVLVGAAWVYLARRPPPWHLAFLAFGVITAFLVPPSGARPLMLFTAGWLLLMLREAWGSRWWIDRRVSAAE